MTDGSYEMSELELEETQLKRAYRRVTPTVISHLIQEKANLIREVIINKSSISQAAKKLKINNSTAKVLIRQHKTRLLSENTLERYREISI